MSEVTKFSKRALVCEPVQSLYGEVAVYQFDDLVRALTLNETVMSLVNVKNPLQIPSPYIASIAEQVRSDTFVVHFGVAGGTLANYIEQAKVNGDLNNVRQVGVEINEQVVALARKWLGLPVPSQFPVRIADVQTEVLNFKAESVGLLVVDLFNADAELPQFVNDLNFWQNCLRILAPDGQVVVNVMDTFHHAEVVRELSNSIRNAFGGCVRIRIEVPAKKSRPKELVNHLVWASRG
jgi:spermidine synthase